MISIGDFIEGNYDFSVKSVKEKCGTVAVDCNCGGKNGRKRGR